MTLPVLEINNLLDIPDSAEAVYIGRNDCLYDGQGTIIVTNYQSIFGFVITNIFEVYIDYYTPNLDTLDYLNHEHLINCNISIDIDHTTLNINILRFKGSSNLFYIESASLEVKKDDTHFNNVNNLEFKSAEILNIIFNKKLNKKTFKKLCSIYESILN